MNLFMLRFLLVWLVVSGKAMLEDNEHWPLNMGMLFPWTSLGYGETAHRIALLCDADSTKNSA
jgi:hypothetical protein